MLARGQWRDVLRESPIDSHSTFRLPFALRHQLLQKIWVAAFMNETEKVYRLTLDLVIDVERKRLRPATREAVRSDVIATAPTNDFPRLTCNAFVECASQSL